MEICDIEPETKLSQLIILSLYRAPTGDFKQFIKKIDDALKYLYLWRYKHRLSHRKQLKKQLASFLTTYNLSHTVNFATRIQNNSSIAIDNIHVDNSRLNLSSISTILN